MTPDNHTKRQYNSPVPPLDPPLERDELGIHDDYHGDEERAGGESEPEFAEDARHFDEEGGFFDFFSGGAPCPSSSEKA